MDEEQVIFDEVGAELKRRMLIMRVGEPVDCDAWWAKLSPEARLRSTVYPFELGETVKRHYLKIEWKPREVWAFSATDRRLKDADWGSVTLVNDRTAVASCIWWLDEGETISGGLRSASEMFWASTGVWPRVGLMWKAPPSKELALGDMGKLSVRMAKWVPTGCVVVL
jgi:hypothetical protein